MRHSRFYHHLPRDDNSDGWARAPTRGLGLLLLVRAQPEERADQAGQSGLPYAPITRAKLGLNRLTHLPSVDSPALCLVGLMRFTMYGVVHKRIMDANATAVDHGGAGVSQK
jgi:hypothetical protein